MDIEIPYWIDKRLGFTLCKINNGVYRLGIWKLFKFRNEWVTNWWKFIDVGRGKDD